MSFFGETRLKPSSGRAHRAQRLFSLGEQPGNEEDLAGRPFVGPAGRILNDALDKAGLDRSKVYVTNVVKHFKFIRRGKRRIHDKPRSSEINTCRPWLDAEIDRLRAEIIVCLGATSAQTLLGKDFRVSVQRGEWIESDLAPKVIATVHPSSLLRIDDEEKRHQETAKFIEDIKKRQNNCPIKDETSARVSTRMPKKS